MILIHLERSFIMRRTVLQLASFVSLLVLVLPAVASAQRAPDTIGRDGYEWQTKQSLENEKLKQWTTELEALSLEEWKTKTIAWLELRPDGEGGSLAVPASYHVGSLQVKKAEVGALDEEGAWTIVPPKRKLPREMIVVLTDQDSTQVECPLRSVADKGPGLLGVFLYDGILRCLPRHET